MDKIIEYINFKDIPGQTLKEKLCKKKKDKAYFSFFTFFDKKSNLNINTIYSILNQSFRDFNWYIICDEVDYKNCLKYFETNKINDSRIIINKKIEEDNLNSLSKSEYYIPADFDSYFDNTLLETIYYNIKYYGENDLYYTNVISIEDEKCINESLISITKRLININNNAYCVHKSKLNDILLEQDKYKNFKNIVHLDFYGIWKNKAEQTKIKINDGIYTNYPQSTLYDYTSVPNEEIIKIEDTVKPNTILCMMPWSKIGGADNFNYDVLKYLKEKNYNILVITTEKCHYEARPKLEQVVDAYYDLTTFLKREQWPNFIKSIIINKNVKMVFQLSSLYAYYLIPWLKYQFPNMPIIDYVHAEDFAWRNGGFPKDSTSVANFLDKTFVCNNHVKELMFDKMNRKINNVETLYIGVDTEKYNSKEVKYEDKETLNFCKNKKVILFPSRFSPEKRPLFLLNVMKEIKKQRDDIVCIMVGGGQFDTLIKDYISSNNLHDIVKVLPMKTNILEYYKLADITMICSLSEGITLTTYESLAMNTPVITADVGGQKEVIINNSGEVVKKYQDIKKDLLNFNYSQEEINEYIEKIFKILNNYDEYTKNENCRKVVIEGFSKKLLFETLDKNISSYIKNGSSIEKNNLTNEEFARQFLVLFNETNKVYYNNSLDYSGFKDFMRNKLWKKWWYRGFVKLVKKMKIDILIKKIYFREK